MGRNVTFDFSAGGGSDSEFVVGELLLEATQVHSLGNRIVLPAPRSVGINAGVGLLEDVTPSPSGTTPIWAYRATARDEISKKAFSWLVGVPEGTSTISFNSLTKYLMVIPERTTPSQLQNWVATTEANADRSELAADRAEAPTDLMNKNLIEDPASLTAGALSAAIAGGVGKVNVATYYGAVPGTDITAKVNQALVENPGRVIYIPEGEWLIDPTVNRSRDGIHPVGIKLSQAGAKLKLSPKAVLKAIPNASENYAIVEASAPDTVLTGGTILGDIFTHTGTTGEWGHCLAVIDQADRFRAVGVELKDAWGDGAEVRGKPKDVSFVDVISDGNRRQGLSIIDAIRPRVMGGAYINTRMAPGLVGLGCGILIEPDAATSREVTGAIIGGGVIVAGNVGPGIGTSSNGRPLSVTISNIRSDGNGAGSEITPGVLIFGDTNHTTIIGMESTNNAGDGYYINTDCKNVTLISCAATANGRHGFYDRGSNTSMAAVVARGNAGAGFLTDTTSDGLTVTGGESKGNAFGVFDISVDLSGKNSTFTSFLVDDAGVSANYGIVIRPSATGTHLNATDVIGTYLSGPLLDQADARIFPPIGTDDLVIEGKVKGQSNNSGATMLAAGIIGEALDRFGVLAGGIAQWSNGADPVDTTLARVALRTLGVGANNAFRLGAMTTASRPSATTSGRGATFYDTTLDKPVWSDGTVWKDSGGVTV